ncbi:MAG TPA: SGNH/GDSL hydrolase family protein [Prevotellaceae bacterium]|nr:SGNH/GDSL hydrolase family protein [Prevotellaceae bacterium]
MKSLIIIIIALMTVSLTNARKHPDAALYGKKINVLGDSYVYNHKEPKENTWHARIAEKYKMVYRNYGKNGNGIVTPKASGEPLVTRYKVMDKDADYIVVVGGKNDYNKQISIDEFKDGLRSLCRHLTEEYADAKICFFTPWRIYPDASKDPKPIKLMDYVDAMIEVCGEYAIPIFDSSRKSDVRMYSPVFRNKYCQTPTDVSHLNARGHLFFMNKAERFLLSL